MISLCVGVYPALCEIPMELYELRLKVRSGRTYRGMYSVLGWGPFKEYTRTLVHGSCRFHLPKP